MKHRSTTPVAKKLTARVVLFSFGVLLVAAGPIQMLFTPSAKADVFDEKIAALQQQISKYQAEAEKLSKQANTLQNQINRLANDKAQLQKQIDLSQQKYDKLVAEIADTEDRIQKNRKALGVTIADLSVDEQVSPLMLLASSSNIGDFIDQQTYRESVRDSLVTIINEIKILKAKLEKDKQAAKSVLDDQKAQRYVLVQKQNEINQLLRDTNGKEASYQKLVSSGARQISQLRQQQAEVIAALRRPGSGVTGGSASSASGYPFYPNGCANQDDGYGYYRCQCVSYVAYRVAADPQASGYAYLGNANMWWDDGTPVSADNVKRGDVIVRATGTWGHVMYVEGVSGNTISFTDFNGVGGPLAPGQGTITISTATSYPYKVIRFS